MIKIIKQTEYQVAVFVKEYHDITNRFVNQKLGEFEIKDRMKDLKENKKLRSDYETLAKRIRKNRVLNMQHRELIAMFIESIKFRLQAVNVIITALEKVGNDLDKQTLLDSNQRAHDLENKLGAHLKGGLFGNYQTR